MNRDPCLDALLESRLGAEIVVVDDASPDDTADASPDERPTAHASAGQPDPAPDAHQDSAVAALEAGGLVA